MLTPQQKQAGRAFRDERQAALARLCETEGPAEPASVFWRVPRHECAAAGGASTGITLREHYEPSPAYWACYCGQVAPAGPSFPHPDCDGGILAAAGGLFAFIWKQGRCPACGLAVRTPAGRFVIAADRLPDRERTVTGERQASPHPGNPRQPGA